MHWITSPEKFGGTKTTQGWCQVPPQVAGWCRMRNTVRLHIDFFSIKLIIS